MVSCNNDIIELVTIYRKIKRRKDTENKNNKNQEDSGNIFSADEQGEDVALLAETGKCAKSAFTEEHASCSIDDFFRFENMAIHKYFYFSDYKGLIQEDVLHNIWNRVDRSITAESLFHQTKYFWFNIFDPIEKDLVFLEKMFNVNKLSIRDIREKNTEDKIDVFKHYTFISMRILVENSGKTDLDFNILVFKNFIITIFDKSWPGIKDTLSFASLLKKNNKEMTPDWILLSIFIEFLQDAQYMLDKYTETQRKVEEMYNFEPKSRNNLALVLQENFDVVYRMTNISQELAQKIEIINNLVERYPQRMTAIVRRFMKQISEDFKETKATIVYKIGFLERSQDVFLALANIRQAEEANNIERRMNVVTIIMFFFFPCQMISGLFGMNTRVPMQDRMSLAPFWGITVGSILFGVFLMGLYKVVLYIQCKKNLHKHP